MAQPYFVWNGIDSRDMGVVVTTYPPIVFPAERAETISIPGRPGFLTRTEGEGVYDGYLKTIGIGCKRWADYRAIAAWLRGSGELIIGSEPGFVYYGRVLREISADRVFDRVYSGSVAWMVQPGKGQVPPESASVWTAAQAGNAETGSLSLYNPGDLPAAPLITVHASGLEQDTGPQIMIGIGDTVISGVNFPRVTVDLSTRGDLSGCVIDLDAMRVTSLDGTENLDDACTMFDIPDIVRLAPRKTTVISWLLDLADYASVSVLPRWRWL